MNKKLDKGLLAETQKVSTRFILDKHIGDLNLIASKLSDFMVNQEITLSKNDKKSLKLVVKQLTSILENSE